MGISRRHFLTGRASGALLLGGLAIACSDGDISIVDPTALDIDPPGWGGTAGQLHGGDAGTSGGSDGNPAGSGGSAGSGELPDGGPPPPPPACAVAFVTPSPDEVPLTFGPADDQDGTACGNAFTTNVVVSSSGATVTLFADDAPVATQPVSGSSSSFEDVLLGSRTPATSTLRAVATMSDGRTCEASLGGLGVDCAGPTCTLTGPNTNAWLTSDDDLNPGTGGLQTNFTLTTEAANAGTEARLFLNGDTANPLVTTVQDDTATFPGVTLSEGPARTVQGECRDPYGNVTLSAVATWSVTLAECEVAIVSPTPGTDPLTLGPGDDQDSEACGTDFTTSVEVATNAASVALQVDGQAVNTLSVNGSSVEFEDVILGTRTPSSSTITVIATMADGRTCTASRESIVVDCEGPSCTLVATTNDPFFNLSNDEDLVTDELQTTFRVDTGAENVDQQARLIINGDDDAAESELFDANGGAASATFSPVTLEEAPLHTVQAECEDEFGNLTRSSALSWAVDLTPCTVEIDSVANDADPITRLLDNVPGGDIQVNVVGRVIGDNCAGVRVGVCGEPLGQFDTAAVDSNGDWTLPVGLADVSGEGEVCAEVQDDAENITGDSVPVEVRSEAPVVEVASPLDGESFNVAGSPSATADLDTATAACEAEVAVNCTDVGAAVTLIVDGDALPTTATCVADAGALAPYAGKATFSSVSLSELSGTHTLAAEQTVAGLVGTSAPITVNSDCVAPVVAITDPVCNSQLHLVDDDEDGNLADLQYSVDVSNGGVPEVSLAVTSVGGTNNLSATGDATTTTFSAVNFGQPGEVTLTASATDPAGNLGTSAACLVTVVVEPTVNILVPTADQVLSTADDCDADGGFGVTVSGTTSAPAGSTVEASVGAATPVVLDPVVAGGGGLNTFSGCVAIEDGVGQVITVVITDAPNPAGSDTVTISTDTQAPTTPVAAPLVSITNRREGQVTFEWSHVADTDGSTLAGYELRCAASAITDDTAWDAARPLTVNTVGAPTGGANASELIPDPGCVDNDNDGVNVCRGFRVGTTEHCLIRGRDIAGQLTPVDGGSGSVAVSVPFEETVFTAVLNSTTQTSFTNVVGLGDVNGDGAHDMLYGAISQGLQLFFGSTAGNPVDTTADVTFTNGGVSGFGAVLANLGDVNGDGIADFAASARALNPGAGANTGMVYVFFGRSTNSWPASITVNPGGGANCGADVCLVGSTASAFFGWDITGTDFNGDGVNDIVVGARASGGVGAVYVILGGTQLQVTAGTSISVPSGNPNGFVLSPPASRSLFGHAIAAVGSGSDARGDLAISALGTNGGNPAALLYMAGEAYPGGSSGLIAPSATPLVEVSVGSGADFATTVKAIGDFNGDNLRDLALGRNFSAGGGLGRAELLRRRDNPTFSEGPGFRFEFSATGVDNDFGSYIATGHYSHPGLLSAGDLDGDGMTELAVGSTTGTDIANPVPGTLALFYGTPTLANRTRATADFGLTGGATSLLVPNFVGDFDGDGFNDLVVIDGGTGTDRLLLLH